MGNWASFEVGDTPELAAWLAASPKESPVNEDLQVGEGVWCNCLVNPHCHEPALIGDPGAQVDVMLAYFDRYGDFCPWNPSGDYAPGCGYR